ncbi:hypothetical protein ACRALDRAFT_2052263, partial [Sodiomyces alcalophilus JCM 7366]|uniref:uncharacterized protein n=1 Tax=Sodiomyces alcalophilus JCM 7366 TaxID=591952 RepID=UPI0039B40D40
MDFGFFTPLYILIDAQFSSTIYSKDGPCCPPGCSPNMRTPSIPFITLHYTYILACTLITFIALYCYGNLSAIDAFFLSMSGSTETGLNSVDIKLLKLYQQICLYFLPHITNLMFISPLIVALRLSWFHKHMNSYARRVSRPQSPEDDSIDFEDGTGTQDFHAPVADTPRPSLSAQSHEEERSLRSNQEEPSQELRHGDDVQIEHQGSQGNGDDDAYPEPRPSLHISYPAELPKPPRHEGPALYIPPPRLRDRGQPLVELVSIRSRQTENEGDAMEPTVSHPHSSTSLRRRLPHWSGPTLSAARSIEKVTSSAFVLGGPPSQPPKSRAQAEAADDKATLAQSKSGIASLPRLSRSVTIGRNSRFFNLTEEDRETLGGVEYRSLKLLLKITSAYFVLGHLLGAICLIPWIHNAPSKYKDWLQESGQNETWWAIYSAQTMFNNLGLTLTPDSMMTFRDATWPMIVMTLLAFAGNTCYPVFLRLIIWISSKFVPRESVTGETLRFLLDHPRRCYTLLFPSRPTWVLFGIVVLLNFIDVTLIITLDLDNPAVNTLPMGPRILAALFQAASARHTGTSSYSLADMNPAVQFSLLAMMYVAVFPIAISVRASNTYEEQSLGIYIDDEVPVDESNGRKYVLMHIRNQLSFDMWYIFLGTFIICAVESTRIMDGTDPGFAVFPIFFEVMSAYGNVGLSLGHPAVSTSLSGQFRLASKLVICALMIRGRHRWLPYALDRAIMLPNERARRGSLGQQADEDEREEIKPNDENDKSLAVGQPLAPAVPGTSSSASSSAVSTMSASRGLADASSLETRTPP